MNAQSLECPACEQGTLALERYDDEYQHNGSAMVVRGLERHRCNICHEAVTLKDQIKRNQLKIADARRATDGLLSAEEIRHVREVARISQSEAARIFGGGVNAFSKYERGEVAQSVAMDRLLRLIRDIPGAAQLAASYAGITLGAPASFERAYVELRSATFAPVTRVRTAKVVVVRNRKYEAA
jgi:HTH-type transcriptional regulator/antitoxin MqsA